MESFLIYTHLTFVLLAVLLFVVSFYWLKTGHENARKDIFKKLLLQSHVAILLIGLSLIWVEHINPFAGSGLWVIEKLGAFVAYIVMVSVALNEDTRKGMQALAFIGAFGWLAYIAKLAISKQAILLVG